MDALEVQGLATTIARRWCNFVRRNGLFRLEQLTQELKTEAQRVGFVLTGVAAAAEPARLRAFHQWLNNGYAGEMQYLHARVKAYSHPQHVLDGCRTLLMLALPYSTENAKTTPNTGRIARYAWGEIDYHDLLHDKLKRLRNWLESAAPGAMVRGVVDTAPLLEREFAEAAGLGWVGKNTLLLNRQWGSYFFLAALLTDLPLVVDAPQDKGYCGTCTACLDACPTAAFVSPYVLDATRCLSYLTIEYRGPIDHQTAEQFDQWLFGCDICQEVCPWNRRVPQSDEDLFLPQDDLNPVDLSQLLALDEVAFRERFRRTPMWRAKRRGMLRNAILLVAQQRNRSVLPQLRSLLEDTDELLRASAQWAISRLESI